MILKYYTYIANYYKLNHSEGLLAVGQHPYSLKALAVDRRGHDYIVSGSWNACYVVSIIDYPSRCSVYKYYYRHTCVYCFSARSDRGCSVQSQC